MKHTLRILVLSCLTAALVTVTAFADTGPKAQLTVKVENAPEGLYYMDLLAEGPDFGEHYRTEKDFAGLDQDLLRIMRAAVPDGWHACILDGDLIFGQLTGVPDGGSMLHTFSYYGVPETYRLLVATQSGEVWISDAYTREVLQSSATVDWADKTVTIPPARIGYVLQFLATFVPTLLIEGLLLALFGFGRQKRNWLCFLAVNFITQGALALVMAFNAMTHGVTGWSLLPFVMLEVVITLGEALLYARLLKGQSEGWAAAYGLAANICSAVLGLYLAEPVWRFIVSIS